ncbi:MAG: class I SAM-dependent methyltransferase [Planctomycetota bacterium]
MGTYTQDTARWLDRRYARVSPDGVYEAHMPIYGLGHPASEAGHMVRFGISYRLLRTLDTLEFDDLLAVGGGEGFLPHLVRGAFGADVAVLDLSVESVLRAHQFFGIDGVAADATRLPFRDGSFDVVVCSEVIEHLEFPVEALLELVRVARRAVIVTTLEFERDREAVARHRFQRCRYPHFEQNLFLPEDLELVLGRDVRLLSELRHPVPADGRSRDETAAWIAQATAHGRLLDDGAGVLCVLEKVPSTRERRRSDDELARVLLDDSAVEPDGVVPPRPRAVPASLLRRMICPIDRDELREDGERLVAACGRSYEVRGGVPILYDLAHPDPTDDDLRERVRGERDAAEVERLVALRRDLVGPSFDGVRSFDLRDVDQRRGWLTAPSLAPGEARDGGYAFVATNGDPWLVSPVVGVSARDVVAVRVAMRVHAPDATVAEGTAQVFWLFEDDDDLGEDRSRLFTVANSPEVREYRIELADRFADEGRRRILLFRLDPADGPCTIELLRFEIETAGAAR